MVGASLLSLVCLPEPQAATIPDRRSMRISIPSISLDPLAKVSLLLPREVAVDRLAEFLSCGNVSALTGAGVSVDSGIRAYRGRNGLYLNPNYHPILYHELVDPTAKGHSFRQRYWARSYLGWPAVDAARPNPTHFALSALQYENVVGNIITQNVDGLHTKATSQLWGSIERERRILELHGRLRVCRELVITVGYALTLRVNQRL